MKQREKAFRIRVKLQIRHCYSYSSLIGDVHNGQGRWTSGKGVGSLKPAVLKSCAEKAHREVAGQKGEPPI